MTAIDTLPIVEPADNMPGPVQGRWTYADYATLPTDGQRYEIIDGVLFRKLTPSTSHQEVLTWFIFYLTTYVQIPGLGDVFGARCDVELASNVIVQPDVLVVLQAHQEIVTPSRIMGAPDLIIEIASPSTTGYGRRIKQYAYARAGVPEYWIADHVARTIEVLVLERGTYRSLRVFQGQATLPSQVLPGLPVRVEQFFA